MIAKSPHNIHLSQAWPAAHYMDEMEIEAVARVLRARSPFRYYGPDMQHEVEKFEQELAHFVGRRFCLGVSSGTAALDVAVAALKVGPGDEVIVPGYFWVSTVAAVVKNGAIPVLADVDESYSLDPEDLKRKINSRTKAVIIVHMGGVIGKVEEVAGICKSQGLGLIEDCAQSIGASKFARMSGSFGDIGVFSFQLNKACTAGEGGALVTDSEMLHARAVALHDVGYVRDDAGELSVADEQGQYWGFGCRMTEITGAILRVQLARLPTLISELVAVKTLLKQVVSKHPGIQLRFVADPAGDLGTFLKLRFSTHELAREFQYALSRAAHMLQIGLSSILMTDWGMHVYHDVPSLTNRRSICGHHSVWERSENSFARSYSYAKGTLPHLDEMVLQTLIFPVPVGLTVIQRDALTKVFAETCNSVLRQVQERIGPARQGL